jgi:hypothetical protein
MVDKSLLIGCGSQGRGRWSIGGGGDDGLP